MKRAIKVKTRKWKRRGATDRITIMSFIYGLAAPALLVGPITEIGALRRGESVEHAWRGVRQHLSSARRRLNDEEKITAAETCPKIG